MGHGSLLGRRGGALALALVSLLVSRSAAPAIAGQAPTGPKLKIVILEGEGAINNIRQRTAREPIVQVQDENDRPVAGAVVIFTLPDRGASGVFANSATSVTVTTDAQGRAAAVGLRPNSVAGEVKIRVDASHRGQTATATISMVNALVAAAAGGMSSKTLALIAIAGGAAVGGVVAATRGSGNGRPPTPTLPTLTAGTPTVGPPR